MQSIHQLANELNRERQAHAERQRPVRQHLAGRRAKRHADRAQRRIRRRAARKALRLRTEPERLARGPAEPELTLVGQAAEDTQSVLNQ
jgi:hypothetical protein